MKNEIRSLEWADCLLEAILSPRSLAVRLAGSEKQLNAVTFLLPVISSAIIIISMALLSSQTEFFYYKITYGWIFSVICTLVHIFLVSSITDLIFQFRGMRGNVRRVINVINISYFPKFMILPFILFFSVIDFAPPFFFIALYIVLSVWSLYIISRGISEIYSVDLQNAFLVYAVPYAAIFIISMLLVFLMIFLGYGFFVNIH